ncbi:MAG: hypothetical protein WD069_14180 [Planctomycetales bacterium]
MPLRKTVRLAVLTALVGGASASKLLADPPAASGVVRISDGPITAPLDRAAVVAHEAPAAAYPPGCPAYGGYPAPYDYSAFQGGYPPWQVQHGLPHGIAYQNHLRNTLLLSQMAASFPHRKAYEWMGGPPVGKGGPIDIMLSHDGRTTYPPDYGFSRPVKQPIYRLPVNYTNYWPNYWYGLPRLAGAQPAAVYPQIAMPTDTTQLGSYYQRVPQWMPTPGMIPPDPWPPHYVAREQPFGVEPTVHPMSHLQYHHRILMHNWYGHPWPEGYPHGPVYTPYGYVGPNGPGAIAGGGMWGGAAVPVESVPEKADDFESKPETKPEAKPPMPIEASNRSIFSPIELR